MKSQEHGFSVACRMRPETYVFHRPAPRDDSESRKSKFYIHKYREKVIWGV
jgi:hypothetical protein